MSAEQSVVPVLASVEMPVCPPCWYCITVTQGRIM